jgi:hypothetical protein
MVSHIHEELIGSIELGQHCHADNVQIQVVPALTSSILYSLTFNLKLGLSIVAKDVNLKAKIFKLVLT